MRITLSSRLFFGLSYSIISAIYNKVKPFTRKKSEIPAIKFTANAPVTENAFGEAI